MATGDAAAAAGLQVFAFSQDKRLGYVNDNQRGDEIAAEIAARAAADTALTGAVALKLDAAKVIFSDTTPANIAGTGYSGRIWIKKV